MWCQRFWLTDHTLNSKQLVFKDIFPKRLRRSHHLLIPEPWANYLASGPESLHLYKGDKNNTYFTQSSLKGKHLAFSLLSVSI